MQPGPVGLTTAGRGRLPWACYAFRGPGLIFPGPLELERVSLDRAGAVFLGRAAPAVASSRRASPGPGLRAAWAVAGAASAGAAAPGADQPTGPRDFPPGFRQGFPP